MTLNPQALEAALKHHTGEELEFAKMVLGDYLAALPKVDEGVIRRAIDDVCAEAPEGSSLNKLLFSQRGKIAKAILPLIRGEK